MTATEVAERVRNAQAEIDAKMDRVFLDLHKALIVKKYRAKGIDLPMTITGNHDRDRDGRYDHHGNNMRLHILMQPPNYKTEYYGDAERGQRLRDLVHLEFANKELVLFGVDYSDEKFRPPGLPAGVLGAKVGEVTFYEARDVFPSNELFAKVQLAMLGAVNG